MTLVFGGNGVQLRLRVRRLMSMPPRLNPRAAPSNAAASIVPVDELGEVREKRAAVYASERVQKASRRYMGDTSHRDCPTNSSGIEASLSMDWIVMATLNSSDG
jgi:hypothetical protein